MARWNAFFLVGITGCLRIGELFAVRWRNLDWQEGRYYVKETWVRTPRGDASRLGPPKTAGSIAGVDLSPRAVEGLREHQTRQKEERIAAGKAHRDKDLIFPNSVGKPMEYWNFTRRVFRPIIRKAGIREVGTHGALRHTGAAIMISNNEPIKYIQRQLRHASITMSLDVYGHLLQDDHNEAPGRMDSLVFGSSELGVESVG